MVALTEKLNLMALK